MAVVGLFSGIGGFEVAFARAGLSATLLAEIDPAASAVLRHHFPDADIRGDVAEIDGLPAEATILAAGFPCQNLSMAGDKAGIDGGKSSIIEQMFRLIELSRIQTVVIENVYFMLQLAQGSAMRYLVERFELLGYAWAYRVLDTLGFGLPQRRRRVYFVASRTLDPRSVLFADETQPSAMPKPSLDRPLGFYWTEGRSGIGMTVDGIPPLKVGSAVGIPSAPAVLFPDGQVLMPSLVACERLQGFAPGWTKAKSITDIRGRRPEWRMVGNAVSVPVASWVAARIRQPGQILGFERAALSDPHRWPDAAWNIGTGRTRVFASDKPISTPRGSIEAFRDDEWSLLSDRALNGFISRAEQGGLRVPNGFLGALRAANRKQAIAA